jgi:hypothetical protein
VAVLNAMFTIGAFITPGMIAASIHDLSGAVWPAYYALSTISILVALALPLLPSPPPPRGSTAPRASVELKTAAHSTASAAGEGKARRSERVHFDEPSDESQSDESQVLREAAAAAAAEAGAASAELKSLAAAPPANSKGTRADNDGSFVYLGDPGSEGLPPYVVVMVTISALCFFATSLEHSTATWLPAFGIKQRGLGEETMAIMSSNFWTAMSIGRIGWAFLSGAVTSAWPAVFANTICCILSGVAMVVPSNAMLWSSAMGIGLGVASSFPAVRRAATLRRALPPSPPQARSCVQYGAYGASAQYGAYGASAQYGVRRASARHPILRRPPMPAPPPRPLIASRVCLCLRPPRAQSMTLPPELGIVMTPRMLMTIQLACSLGEMLGPFVIGLAFEMRRYSFFYELTIVSELLVLALLVAAWLLLTRRLALPRTWLSAAGAQ